MILPSCVNNTHQNSVQAPTQPMYFHSCFYYAKLIINACLVDMVMNPVPDSTSIVSDFDLWIHQGIFPMSQILEDRSDTFYQV
jgi:hypothetical protein